MFRGCAVRLLRFVFPFLASVAIHGIILSSGVFNLDSHTPHLKPGETVKLNLIFSSNPGDSHAKAASPASELNKEKSYDSRIRLEQDEALLRKNTQNVKLKPDEDISPRKTQGREQIVRMETVLPEHHARGADIVREALKNLFASSPEGYHGEEAKYSGSRREGKTTPVKVLGLSKPKYPRYSRLYGEEGTVLISVEVFADGKPGAIEVVSSSGYKRLDKAALAVLKKARFVPAKKNGRAVDSKKYIEFKFDLENWEKGLLYAA
jgi:TonB family protein